MILCGLPGKRTLRFWIPAVPGGLPPVARIRPAAGGAGGTTAAPLRLTTHSGTTIGYRILVTDLSPDSEYHLEAAFPGGPQEWSVSVRTLPERLETPFTVATGSCFSLTEDRGRIASSYPPGPYRQGVNPVRVRFLTGDQIYADLHPTSGDPLTFSPPDLFTTYSRHWSDPSYGTFLAATPSCCLADDHEYWNDFPHRSIWLRWSGNGLANPVGQAADELFELYQAALNPAAGEEGVLANGAGMPGPRGFCRSFSFDVGPLSFFGLDCRTRRGFYTDGAPRFVERDAQGQQPELDALASWARSLSGPGVLVLPQPLVETPATWLQRKLHVMGDVNLPDYGGDYRRIWDTLFCSTPHSILILTGDIHVSRLFEVRPLRVPGAFQKSIYELASSPLCHIKQGSSKPPGKSVTIDSSGHLGEERLVFARLWPPGLAHRRTYATVTFRPPLATRIVADIELWAAEASDPRGARGPYPLARHSLNLT